MMADRMNLEFEHTIRIAPKTTTQGVCFRPTLPVRLSYENNQVDLDAMIDTGADFSMFDLSVSRSLGIPDNQLELDNATTLEGKTRTWYCTIDITLLGKSCRCRVGFIDNPKWLNVIGRDTIFSEMKFAFRQSARQFYVSLQS